MADDAYFEGVRKAIRDEANKGGGASKEDVFWAVMEGTAAVVDCATGTPVASPLVGGLETLRATVQANGERKGVETTPNPWFVLNGQDEGDSKATQKYLRHRTFKSIGSGIIGVASAVASSSTYVDVGGIAQNANAIGTTGAHLYKFRSIANRTRQSKTIAGWIELLIKMKAIKAAIRTTQLAGSSIPVPLAGAITGVVAAAAKLGVKFTMTKLCLALSADLHWRAFQEQAISRNAKAGPASAIVYELFTRRGATRIFGKYDVDQFVKEPCGWMAISDKILLI